MMKNLLEPGHTPHEKSAVLVFLCSVIKAEVDEYADLLPVGSKSAMTMIGCHEAPPAIISIFLGEQLQDILEQIEKGGATSSKTGGGMETVLPLAGIAERRYWTETELPVCLHW